MYTGLIPIVFDDAGPYKLAAAEKQGEDAAADIDDVWFPCPVTVVQFGAICTEDFDVAGANAAIASLDLSDDDADTNRTEIATITFPKANTAKGGKKYDIVFSTDNSFPLKVAAGQVLNFEHKQAASDAGGAYRLFALIRVDGYKNDKDLGIAS